MVILTDNTWTMRNVNNGAAAVSISGSTDCTASNRVELRFVNGSDTTGYNLATGLCGGTWDGTQCGAAPGNACQNTVSCKMASALMAEIVRYRIRPGADGVPNLERFSSASATNGFASGAPKFEVIARGIDDMQVRYTAGNGAVTDAAPAITAGDFNTITQRVAVTLSARSEAKNIAGARSVTSGPAAIRGALTSSEAPRAALVALSVGPSSPARAAGQPSPWN
jgi:hypothetical protein